MTKQPKLTPAQQTVVNLMAAGWELHWSREAFGGRIRASAWLVSPKDKHQKLRSDLPAQLIRKGLIARTTHDGGFIPNWDHELTKEGRELAK